MSIDKKALRFGLALGLLGLFALLVLFRYALLAGEGGKPRPSPLDSSERGLILDRSGRVLAVDSPLYNIAVWKPETDPVAFPAEAERLASLVDLPPDEVLSRWKEGSGNFFYLRKRVSPQVARAVQEAKAAGAFAGVVVERVAGRLYPEKRLASHLVGFVGDANRGLVGIESKYDEELTPKADEKGRLPPQGDGVVLTIDANIQFALEEVARRALKDTGATAVILLAGDVATGEILAYVAMPDYDPNEFLTSPDSAWYDWASVYAYEPGSVFKVFSMASVLDLGVITDRTTFLCDGAYHLVTPSGEKITIKDLEVHGTVDITGILEYSCNSGAGQASDRAATVDFYDKLSAFGFGSRTGLTLPGESPGALRSPETWSLRSKPTIAMGQEVLVTATQMLAAAMAVGDGGILRKPLVVGSLRRPDGSTLYENQSTEVRRVISSATARAILTAMEAGAGIGGTGRRAKVDDVRMAVKTGTAQMIDRETKRYSTTDFIASTLAIFPADAPRIALYGAIIKPAGETYGGRIAAPMIREGAEALLELTDIARGGSPVIQHPGRVSLPRLGPIEIGGTMPDLRGVPKRLLLPLLDRSDLKVRIEGNGYVVRQRPESGRALGPGAEIVLELE